MAGRRFVDAADGVADRRSDRSHTRNSRIHWRPLGAELAEQWRDAVTFQREMLVVAAASSMRMWSLFGRILLGWRRPHPKVLAR